MAIKISTIATVSTASNNPVRELTVGSNNTPAVAVSFYAFQTTKSDDGIPAMNLSAMFFGKERIETVKQYLRPGTSVLLSGQLVQKVVERDGKTYVDNDVRYADFEFLPRNGETPADTNNDVDQSYTQAPTSPQQTLSRPTKPTGGRRLNLPKSAPAAQ